MLELRELGEILSKEVDVDEFWLLDCHLAHKLVQFSV